VDEEARRLRELGPDLLLADVPYRPLVSASRVGLQAVALCSLNWADVFRAYCGHLSGADAIYEAISAAYYEASLFIRPEPAMPMPNLSTRAIGPIVRPAMKRHREIRGLLGLDEDHLVGVVALGGIPTDLEAHQWATKGLHLLVPKGWATPSKGLTSFDALVARGFHFSDILASSDVVVTKPGYNTFVEAAAFGIPVLYVARGDWPEEPFLTRWLRDNGCCREISRRELTSGSFVRLVPQLVAAPRPAPPSIRGAEEAVALLAPLLS
jgi:hypothetical protein